MSSSASSSSARGPPQPGNAQAHVADSDVLAPLGHRMGLPADPRRGVPGTGRRRVPGVPPGQVSLEPCRQDQPVAVGQRRAVAGASHDAFPATQLTEAASGGRRPVRARGQRLGHDRSAGDDPARFGATGGLARPPSVANPRCAARAPVRRSAISRSGGTPCPFRARQAATARRLVATPNGGSERVLPACPLLSVTMEEIGMVLRRRPPVRRALVGLMKLAVGWPRCLSMPRAPWPSGCWIVAGLTRALLHRRLS